MLRLLTGLVTGASALLVAILWTVTRALGSASQPDVDDGLRLAVVVIPVLVIALLWLAYIFWLIFHGEQDGDSS